MLNQEYRVYILQPFYLEMIEENFENWIMKDMVGWHKFVNHSTKATIEFYGHGNPYKIKNPDLVTGNEFTFPYPNNLDEFICDCERCSVNLLWNNIVISTMSRAFFMNQSEIENYNKKLLEQIEKS